MTTPKKSRYRKSPYRSRSVVRLAEQILAADRASFKRYRKSRKRLVGAPVALNKREVESYGPKVRKVTLKAGAASTTQKRKGRFQDSKGRWHAKTGAYIKTPRARSRKSSSAAPAVPSRTRRAVGSFYRSRGY